jgi:hypothetical protein
MFSTEASATGEQLLRLHPEERFQEDSCGGRVRRMSECDQLGTARGQGLRPGPVRRSPNVPRMAAKAALAALRTTPKLTYFVHVNPLVLGLVICGVIEVMQI